MGEENFPSEHGPENPQIDAQPLGATALDGDAFALRKGEEAFETDEAKARSIADAVNQSEGFVNTEGFQEQLQGQTEARERLAVLNETLNSSELDGQEREVASREAQRLERGIERDHESVEKRIGWATDKFTEFYNINPDIFATMPTADFIQEADRYRELKSTPEFGTENVLPVIRKAVEWAVGAVEKDETEQKSEQEKALRWLYTTGNLPMHGGNITSIHSPRDAGKLWEGLEGLWEMGDEKGPEHGLNYLVFSNTFRGDQSFNVFERTFEAVEQFREGWYDRTPRQSGEIIVNLLKDVESFAAARTEKAQRELDEFLSKYQPAPSTDEHQQES